MVGFALELSDHQLAQLLADDVPFGDLTTEQLDIGARGAIAVFQARTAMRVCAIEEAARLFELSGARARILTPSGLQADAGMSLLKVEGTAHAVLKAWKVAQTLVEYASGMATSAAEMVDALRSAGFHVPVACTRKHFPGTKAIAVKAVRCGGAIMHRLGLSDTILVFPEHLVFMTPDERVTALEQLRRNCPERKIAVEAVSLNEALTLARLPIDVLQVDKFSIPEVETISQALQGLAKRPLLAAAGGISLANAVRYARAGAELLVTSTPYFANPRDVKVLVSPSS